jgi:hypothetical protein
MIRREIWSFAIVVCSIVVLEKKTEKCGNMIDIFTCLSWWTIIFPHIVLNWKFNIDLGCMIVLPIKKKFLGLFTVIVCQHFFLWIKYSTIRIRFIICH